VPDVKSASGSVGNQVHVRARGNFAADSLKQDGEDDIAETSALMLGEHGHVDHMEVPAPIAK
jgi:hypothetical protein